MPASSSPGPAVERRPGRPSPGPFPAWGAVAGLSPPVRGPSELRITAQAVESHLKHVYIRLGAPTRGAAIALAYDAPMLGTPRTGP